MATIQLRELPEDSYEVLRRRARRSGKSLGAYLRAELVDLAERPTKAEALERIEAVLKHQDGAEPAAATLLGDLAAERR
jgi:plasmid stability protein